MPRTKRYLPEEGALHILARGNNKQKIFKDDIDYKTCLKRIFQYKEESNILIYHYCLMPTHIHMIVEISNESTLSRFMKQLEVGYVHHYKRRYDYIGHFWQDRYKSLLISNDSYLITCARYVELNPVRAELVKNPEDYRYSSYKAYAYGYKNDIITYDPIYLELGNTNKKRQIAYRLDIENELHVKPINFNARFFGSKRFVKDMENKFKVRNINTGRGRPKKSDKI
ncbi:transposase [Candidatus Omnitrophota bacterium]